jgi:hypothetical protein
MPARKITMNQQKWLCRKYVKPRERAKLRMKTWGGVGWARTDVGIGLGDIRQHQQPQRTKTASLGAEGLKKRGSNTRSTAIGSRRKPLKS